MSNTKRIRPKGQQPQYGQGRVQLGRPAVNAQQVQQVREANARAEILERAGIVEEPPPPREPTPEEQMQMAMMQAAQYQRPPIGLCAPCASAAKLAMMKINEDLSARGLQAGSPEHFMALRQQLQENQIGDPRPADLLINGTGVCMVHFQPQEAGKVQLIPGSEMVMAQMRQMGMMSNYGIQPASGLREVRRVPPA